MIHQNNALLQLLLYTRLLYKLSLQVYITSVRYIQVTSARGQNATRVAAAAADDDDDDLFLI